MEKTAVILIPENIEAPERAAEKPETAEAGKAGSGKTADKAPETEKPKAKKAPAKKAAADKAPEAGEAEKPAAKKAPAKKTAEKKTAEKKPAKKAAEKKTAEKKPAAKKKAEKKNILKLDLNEQAKEIFERAQAAGVENSYLFATTFKRYQEHIEHLQALQKAIGAEGMMVHKEYVKGRKNLYVNPAVNAYNSTASAADKTAKLLLDIIAPIIPEEEEKDDFDRF